ncbi:DMT family transporter [Rhizobacter sp. SG703]|uniref:DMT family transporter n=1 Tax=Rhizobacter sp. SG703 TaxID=2587140 RepID=UPI0014487110|nr:DMT family transporter [Rhizobacter sp. SG703]NKI93276.1 drug/metabolite transporter (DMT)-like permease [Rhizobacter sp. SG703]
MDVAPLHPVASLAQRAPGRGAMLLLALFALAWAVVEGVFGARLQLHYSLMQVVWCRYAVHLACLGLLVGWRAPSRLWRTRRLGFQLSRSLLMLVMPASFALSLAAGDRPGTVWALFWVAPLMILGFARLALGERVPRWVWAVAAIGSGVAAVMAEPALPRSLAGAVLPIVMALSFSIYVVMTRALRDEPVQANLFFTALGVFALLTPLMPFVWVMPNLHDAALLAGIGIVGLLALWALDRACERAPVAQVAPTLHVHLLCMALVEWGAAGEAFTHRDLLGAAWIGLALLALWLWQSALERTPAT